MWVVISLHLYAKLSLPLPSTKYLSSIKNNPKIEWDLRHWIISLYTKKKVFFPPRSRFVQQMEAPPG